MSSTGVVAAVALVAASLLATGFSPVESKGSSRLVWVAKSPASVGRVNTAADEMDDVEESSIAPVLSSTADGTLALVAGHLLSIDDANPSFDPEEADAGRVVQLEGGVDEISRAGGTILLLSSGSGEAFSAVDGEASATLSSIAPIDVAGTVRAGTVTEAGQILLLVSDGDRSSILRYDRAAATTSTEVVLEAVPTNDAAVSMTSVGNEWALLGVDEDEADVYTRAAPDGVALPEVDDASTWSLQQPSGASDRIIVSAAGALASVPLGGGDPAIITPDGVGDEMETGRAVRGPGGCVVVAWVGADLSSGVIASVCGDDAPTSTALSAPPSATVEVSGLADVQMRGVGDDLLLNEATSGHVWHADGTPVASSWSWTDPDQRSVHVVEQDQASPDPDPEAPVAVDDTYSIRPGRASAVSVMANDYDSNHDPLYISTSDGHAPEVASGGDGISVDVVNHARQLSVTVPAAATGGIVLTYQVSDGTGGDDGGRYSNTATVALAILTGDQNTPPSPPGDGIAVVDVAAGGSVEVNALEGWTDAELDPLFLSSARFADPDDAATATIVGKPDGTLLLQHLDANSTGGEHQVRVSVSDGRSSASVTAAIMTFRVSPSSAISVLDTTVTGRSGAPLHVDLAKAVRGGFGAVTVSTIATTPSSGIRTRADADGAGFTATADAPGDYMATFTVTDSRSQIGTGRVLLHIVDGAAQGLTVPPLSLRIAVGRNSTVDVADSVSGAGDAVALITQAVSSTGKVKAVIVDYSAITLITTAGVDVTDFGTQVDTVTFTVSAGGQSVRGQIAVFLDDSRQASDQPPLAIDDQVLVASGTLVDIRVLSNDVDSDGGALSLDSRWTSEDPDDSRAASVTSRVGLYFPSGDVIRYQAPRVDATTTLSFPYRVVGSNGRAAIGTVRVTVVPSDQSGDIDAPDIEARTSSGQSVSIPLPVDISGTSQTAAFTRVGEAVPGGGATIRDSGRQILFRAPTVTQDTDVRFAYTVTIASGRSAQGTVRVGVSAVSGSVDPIAVGDFVTVATGSAALLSPIANDIAPSDDDVLSLGGREDPRRQITVYAYEQGTTDDPDAAQNASTPNVRAAVDPADPNLLVITPSATTLAGTYWLHYMVAARSGGTDEGRITVTFVDDPVTVSPVVDDTVVEVSDYVGRTFITNVVNGRVTWAGGDLRTLRVSPLEGVASGVTVTGHAATGTRPATTERVPLRYSGTTTAGEEVSSYAFLIIPGTFDIAPALADAAARAVDAGSSITFDVVGDVVYPDGAGDVTLSSLSTRTSEGTASASGTALTYVASDDGAGADFVAFTVVFTLDGARRDAQLSLPVTVIPRAPVPVLRGYANTISPGDSADIPMLTMIAWKGTDDAKRALEPVVTVTSDPAAATATLASGQTAPDVVGDAWRIAVTESAQPGTVVRFSFTVRGYDGSARAAPSVAVEITVGVPNRGRPVAAQCTAELALTSTSAMSQTYQVVGGDSSDGCSGERNPYTSASLSLGTVTVAKTAPGVSVDRVGSSQVRVSFADPQSSALPSVLTVSFTVRDVQGIESAGDALGTLAITLRKLPVAPSGVSLQDFGDGTVTVCAAPSGSGVLSDRYVFQRAKSGSSEWVDLKSVSATGSGCIADELGNGASGAVDYRAYGENDVGRSLHATSALTGVYPQAAPSQAPSATWYPEADASGRATVTIDGTGDPSAGWTVSWAGGTSYVKNSGTSSSVLVDVGAEEGTTVTVIAHADICEPCERVDGYLGNAAQYGQSTTLTGVRGFGTPAFSDASVTIAADNSATVTFTPHLYGPSAAATDLTSPASWSWSCDVDGASCGTLQDGTPVTVSNLPASVGENRFTITVSNGVARSSAVVSVSLPVLHPPVSSSAAAGTVAQAGGGV